MARIHCMNNISKKGTDQLPAGYELTDDLAQADGILVRSAKLHDTEFPPSLLAGANANAVKELVLCGMLLGSRGIADGIIWCRDNADDPDIAKSVEAAKKQ